MSARLRLSLSGFPVLPSFNGCDIYLIEREDVVGSLFSCKRRSHRVVSSSLRRKMRSYERFGLLAVSLASIASLAAASLVTPQKDKICWSECKGELMRKTPARGKLARMILFKTVRTMSCRRRWRAAGGAAPTPASGATAWRARPAP